MTSHDLILVGPIHYPDGKSGLYTAQCSGTGDETCFYQSAPGTIETVTRAHTEHAIKKETEGEAVSEPTVRSYHSFEDMLADMHANEDVANARASEDQKSLRPGDYVWRGIVNGSGSLLIVGETFTEDAYIELEREAARKQGNLAEFDEGWERKRFQERVARGYLTGRWYSEDCPQGELGDAHISVLMRCPDRETFDAMLSLVRIIRKERP